jgi:hypothetical protein
LTLGNGNLILHRMTALFAAQNYFTILASTVSSSLYTSDKKIDQDVTTAYDLSSTTSKADFANEASVSNV